MLASIQPYIRRVDDALNKRACSPANVHRSDNISVMLETTIYASEQCLCNSILATDMVTSWTLLRSVFGVNEDNGYTSFQCFVSDKELEFTECPTMEVCSLRFSVFCCVLYSGQIFHYYDVACVQGINELSTDLVQYRVSPLTLLTCNRFQFPFCGFCAFGLESLSLFSELLSPSKNIFTISFESVRCNDEFIHSQIYANRIITCRFGYDSSNWDMEIKPFSLVNQNCICWVSSIQKSSLVFTSNNRDFNSSINGRDTCINTVLFEYQSEYSFIQVHRCAIEFDKFSLFSFICFSNSISCSYHKIRWQLECQLTVIISNMVQCYRIEYLLFKCYFRNKVTAFHKLINCAIQDILLFISRIKFTYDGFSYFHTTGHICMSIYSLACPQFLFALKSGVSLRWFP